MEQKKSSSEAWIVTGEEPRVPLPQFSKSLPFWWIVLTVIYVALTFLGGGYIAGLLGLFVPIGIWNFYSSFRPIGESSYQLWIITFPLVLLTIFGGEWFIRKLKLSPALKIFVILGILFVLTITVDFIVWGGWVSLEFLRAGGKWDLTGTGW